jgi:hypothetical protein
MSTIPTIRTAVVTQYGGSFRASPSLADVSHTTFIIIVKELSDMDSDSPAESRIAGQPSDHTGIFFTAISETFKSEFENDAFGRVDGASGGLRHYRRSADGHGHPA